MSSADSGRVGVSGRWLGPMVHKRDGLLLDEAAATARRGEMMRQVMVEAFIVAA